MSAQRRTTGRRSTTRRTGSSRSRSSGARRRQGLPSTVGAALGTLVVTSLLDLSWPARIGLLLLVVVVGLGYVLWRHRADIVAGAQPPTPGDPPADTVGPQDRPSEGTSS